MNTGENDQGLRAAADFARKGSIVLLALHFYLFCYASFMEWGWTMPIVERTLLNLSQNAFIGNIHVSKLFILILLVLSFMGSKGKKDEKIIVSGVVTLLVLGIFFFMGSAVLFYLPVPNVAITSSYIFASCLGFLCFLTGGARISRLIKTKLRKDIFNAENETFPQEERLVANEHSINLPATYVYNGKVRNSFVNFPNPYRAILITGSPGSSWDGEKKENKARVITVLTTCWFNLSRRVSQFSVMISSMMIYQKSFTILTYVINMLIKNNRSFA